MLTFENNIELIVYIIEVIGCISFATSGAITAIRKHADVLGVLILTLIEVFGGGLLRDTILHKEIPHILWDPEYLILALICIIISIMWFVVAYVKKTAVFIDKHRHDFWIYFLDAVGIAVFCLAGVDIAAKWIPDTNFIGHYVFMITIGVISGTCGGMFRDVFIGEIPMVFRKHFYMTPCIIGCLFYSIIIELGVDHLLSLVLGIILITTLRTLAIIYKWNLPSAKGYNELTNNK